MRIIAGEYKGRTLLAPKGMDTRPTLDRVRESLFSILMPYLPSAAVLDLFAGSGALGLEAVSRGAAHAVFVDHGRAAQDAVAQNIQAIRAQERARLLRCDWRAAIATLQKEGGQFDLVFLDPPYRMPQADKMLATLRDSGLLCADAMVVYEHDKATPPDATGWTLADVREYRDTVITFLQPQAGEGQDADSAVSGEL